MISPALCRQIAEQSEVTQIVQRKSWRSNTAGEQEWTLMRLLQGTAHRCLFEVPSLTDAGSHLAHPAGYQCHHCIQVLLAVRFLNVDSMLLRTNKN